MGRSLTLPQPTVRLLRGKTSSKLIQNPIANELALPQPLVIRVIRWQFWRAGIR